MKKLRNLLVLAGLGVIATLGGCESDSTKESTTKETKIKLTATGPGGTYCVTGSFTIAGGSLTTPVTTSTTCSNATHTFALQPGVYTATMNMGYVCSKIPTDPTLTGCVFNDLSPNDDVTDGPVTFTVVQNQAATVNLPFKFQSETDDDETVVFGAGAAVVSVTPSDQLYPICGGTIGVAGADGEQCAANQSCLDLQDTGTSRCYTDCTVAGSSGPPCSVGETCTMVIREQGAGGEGGGFSVNDGDEINSPSDIPTVCVPNAGAGGAGGSGGAPAAGAGGTAGAPAAGSGGVAGMGT
jgi:hypothetical protein